MIEINAVRVYGLSESVYASGYPMQKTYVDPDKVQDDGTMEKAWKRAGKLGNAEIGAGHDQFLSTIIVQFDIKTSVKMWTELQRYNWMTFCSSESTMHCITKFNLDDRYDEHVDKRII